MSMADKKQKEQDAPVKNGKDKMEIEITRYKGIVTAFNSPRTLAKLIIVTSLILVLVFFGISVIALVVKNYYPYKTVNSNEYGATIIENEDNEVIYWLFNTADLWANSGIHVKKGDVISVRASGAFHSSIHHLVEDADSNRMRRNWVKPVGGPNQSPPTDREKSRSSYRISSEQEFNTLLMQVIPESVELRDGNGNWTIKNACYLDGRKKETKNNNQTIDHNLSIYPDIYAIGAERDKITIRSDGVLHFAVNDIAMTRNVIMEMKEKVKIGKKNGGEYKDTSKLEIGYFPIPNKKDTNLLNDLLEGMRKIGFSGNASDTMIFGREPTKKNDWDKNYRCLYNHLNKRLTEDTVFYRKNYTELDYYLIRNFVDAWFVDNAGSYLIVIERKKQ